MMIDEEKNKVTEQEKPLTKETLSEQAKIESQKRRIRSFVRRTGRLTAGQQLGYDRQWDNLGFSLEDGEFDIPSVFGRQAYTVLEIGFGMGQSFIEMAKAAPEKNYIGIEVHTPGVGSALRMADEENLTNVRISQDDAIEVLKHQIADESFDCLQLFFPDPWHKKRHNKRRIVNEEFIQMIRCKMKLGGIIHMATDWEPYAEHMMEVLTDAAGFKNQAGDGRFTPRPDNRPLTKFEKRGERLGHGVWDLFFEKIS
jgi:tRNA (guanine-N7-)-methyltransferase